MKKLVLVIAGLAIAVASLTALHMTDVAQDEKFCALIENQESFDGTTVDMLWHWKTQGHPSNRFLRLYEAKIKDLPGWRP